jgi:hypothetical protein
MTVNHRQGPGADAGAQARELLAAATRGVEQLESAAAQASYRLAALAGVLARREGPAVPRAPEAAETAALGAAGVCRAANALLCYVCSHEWRPVRVVANGGSRGGRPAEQAGQW